VELRHRRPDSPAVADGVVYVGSSDYNVYALKASTGALLWKLQNRLAEGCSRRDFHRGLEHAEQKAALLAGMLNFVRTYKAPPTGVTCNLNERTNGALFQLWGMRRTHATN
jgi:glucose dehydrogenase